MQSRGLTPFMSLGLGDRRPWTNPDLPELNEGDEAIIRYVRTTPIVVRSLAVDRENNIWAGSELNGWQELIDAPAGVPITGQKVHVGAGGYGAVVDHLGALWSAGYPLFPGGEGLLRYDPGPVSGGLPGTTGSILMPGGPKRSTQSGYGIGIDPSTGDVWLGDYDSGGVWQFKQNHSSRKLLDQVIPNNIKGIAIDGKGNVWIGHAGTFSEPGTEVYRVSTSGDYIGAVTLNHPTKPGVVGAQPYGVSIDSAGMIWAICHAPASDGKYYAMRIDPSQGVGLVVDAIDLGDFPPPADFDYKGPYNYSDMTGFVPISSTQPAGVWDFVEDSSVADTVWSSVSLDATVNNGTMVVEVRAANAVTALPSWSFRTVQGNTVPHGTKGRYLEVRINMLRQFGDPQPQGPVLRKATVTWHGPGSNLAITAQPQSRILNLGDTTSLSVTATAANPGALAYQWYKDSSAISGANASTLTIANAQYASAGRYFVRIADNSQTPATLLSSADVRVHVLATPDPTLMSATFSSQSPNLGDPLAISASMDISPSPGPVYYQWRKNGVPIPGASGTCTSIGSVYSASYSIGSVQCSDSGSFSVVFTNEYWKVASEGPSYPNYELNDYNVIVFNGDYPIPPVEVTPNQYVVTDPNNPADPTFTAVPCFTPASADSFQWYQLSGPPPPSRAGETPRPSSTSTYTLTPPVRDPEDYGYYNVDVFDAGWFPYNPAWADPFPWSDLPQVVHPQP